MQSAAILKSCFTLSSIFLTSLAFTQMTFSMRIELFTLSHVSLVSDSIEGSWIHIFASVFTLLRHHVYHLSLDSGEFHWTLAREWDWYEQITSLYYFLYLFIWLHQVLVASSGTFHCGAGTLWLWCEGSISRRLSCSAVCVSLVTWPRSEPAAQIGRAFV